MRYDQLLKDKQTHIDEANLFTGTFLTQDHIFEIKKHLKDLYMIDEQTINDQFQLPEDLDNI